MELIVLDVKGIPDGGIISVRSGPLRRQSPLPCVTSFKLPGGPWPLRIDILAPLSKSLPNAKLEIDADGYCKVPLEARDGRKRSVTLQVFEGSFDDRPKTAPVKSKEPRRDTEAEARSYLDRHRLHEFMHGLFELLLRERPADPHSFIAERFRQAALVEAREARHDKEPGPQLSKVSRSTVSTAPTSSPLKELPQDGAHHIIVRSMRGRLVARFVAQPNMKMSEMKTRLEASVGLPCAAQQLFFWAEVLPNDTSLEDHFVPPGSVCLNLVTSHRTPRLRHCLTGSSEGGIRLWNLEEGEPVRNFSGSSTVLTMAFNGKTMRALTGSFDGRLQLWDATTGRCEQELQAHKEEICCLEVDWDGMRAVTGSSDCTAKLWNLSVGTCLLELTANCTVWTVAVDWSASKICGGLRTGIVRQWDMKTGAVLQDLDTGLVTAKASGTSVASFSIDVAGRRALSAFEDGHLALWQFPREEKKDDKKSPVREEPKKEPKDPKEPKTTVVLAHYTAMRTIVAKWQPTGSRALCGADDGSLSLWNVDTMECIARFVRHIGFVWAIYADWEHERALSGAFDGCLKLWDLRTGECLRTMQGHSRPIRSLAGSS